MGLKFPVRLCIGIQIFFACYVLYMVRISMSINLLAMVKEPKKGDNITSECHSNKETAKPLTDLGPRYDWTRDEQGWVLAAYFYGYLVTCAPGGYLADRFGAMRVTLIGSIASAIFNGIVPIGAAINVWAVFVLRFLAGLTSGVVYPALQSLIARWAPPAEKGKFVAALMGNTLGSVITLQILGVVNANMNWLWAFIMPSAAALLWCVTWFFTVADSPSDHWFISEEERDYINNSLSGGVKKVKVTPPYIKMALNIPFWALTAAHFGSLWGLYLLQNNGPMYMKEALGFNIKSSGFLSSLPYLARLIFGIIFGMIGDYLKKNGKMSMTTLRKFFTIFSHIIPGLFLLAVIVTGCNWVFATTVIVLSLGFNGAATITNLQNCQDLSPVFSGTIYGLINFIGSTTGAITPAVTSELTKHKSTPTEWSIIFGIGGIMYIAGGVIFIIFGSGNVQPFNTIEEPPPQAT